MPAARGKRTGHTHSLPDPHSPSQREPPDRANTCNIPEPSPHLQVRESSTAHTPPQQAPPRARPSPAEPARRGPLQRNRLTARLLVIDLNPHPHGRSPNRNCQPGRCAQQMEGLPITSHWHRGKAAINMLGDRGAAGGCPAPARRPPPKRSGRSSRATRWQSRWPTE